MNNRNWVNKFFIIIVLLIIWQGVIFLDIYPKALFPSLEKVFKVIIKDFKIGGLINSIIYSFSILIKGILIATVMSFVLVILSQLNTLVYDFVDLLVIIAHPLPGIAIIPLVILWVGIGEKAILFIIVHSMLWPMIINLRAGIYSISKTYFEVGKVFNVTVLQRIKHIYFMGLLPSLISGIKIAWARGWRALISSEMVFGVLGTSTGLGWYIFEKRVYMDTPGLYGGLFIIIILGIIVEKFIFEKIEENTINKWMI